jgi:hypothetical protein
MGVKKNRIQHLERQVERKFVFFGAVVIALILIGILLALYLK